MLRILLLLLPTLFPSWRFFKTVAPSPRIELRAAPDGAWQEDRPLPSHVSLWTMLRRLFWNADWNERLYLVSLSERLVIAPSPHSTKEITRLLTPSLKHHKPGDQKQYRIVFHAREGAQMVKAVAFESAPFSVPGSEP